MTPFLRNPHRSSAQNSPESSGRTFLIDLKVIPNAKRNQIVGPLGNRLKVKVNAPPEAGKANAAVCKLLAHKFKVKSGQVLVVAGQTSPDKTVEISGLTELEIRRRLQGH